MADKEFPLVSVVIVNFNGAKHMSTCLDSLSALNYPQEKIEVIVVDNDSKDDSVSLLREKYSKVKLIQNKENYGFAKAVNQGVEAASGKYVALLNNDMKVDKEWLIELVEPVLKNSDLACTGSKVLDWEGKKIDFVLGMMNFEGRGFQIDFEKTLRKGEYNKPKDMLFVNGGSMLVKREVFLEVGGFDEDYFAFYEDVDFGWRLWIAGYCVRFIPTSIAYHRHHGTSSSFGQEKLQLLYERNALFTIYKNYSKPVLDKVLSAALLLLNKRAYLSLGVDKETYRLDHKDGDNSKSTQVQKQGVSYLLAVDDFIEHLPRLREERKKIQALRKRNDETLFRLFGETFFSIFSGKEYQDAQIEVQHALGVYDVFLKPKRNKVLILTHELVSDKMAGPGIRCFEIAKVLARENEVTIAVPNEDPKTHPLFDVKTYKWGRDLKIIAEDMDVIICQGISLASFPFLTELDKVIVVDIYDPFVLSLLEQHKNLDFDRRYKECSMSLMALRYQLEKGDYFICASEKQKDFWLGILTALGRVNPQTYDSDITLNNLIDVVPFGVPSATPEKSKKVIKGVVDGVDEKDKIVLWGGGIYNWFDPLSLIRAFALIKEKRSDVKLFFMGVASPNPKVPEMAMATSAIKLSEQLGLTGNTVFFNDDWVPYEERVNYLLEADIGISTHFNHIETRFSFRTRMLDCLWADIPIVCTKGDSISQLVEAEKLGVIVEEGDINGIAEGILKLVDNDNFHKECKLNIKKIKKRYLWEKAVEPLLDFCRMPHNAADSLGGFRDDLLVNPNQGIAAQTSANNGYFGKIKRSYQRGGFREVVKKSIYYVRERV